MMNSVLGIEEFPLTADPGTEFQYSNLTSNWLGIIVDRACGMHLKPYAEEHLFSPLDMEAGEWGTDWDGHNNCSGDLHLRARDMARFEQLIVLVDELDLVVVTTADPFYLQSDGQSWKHEKATISLVADFIDSLPGE
jgi:CubicO group peptidase (beta-lactamase class C family)